MLPIRPLLLLLTARAIAAAVVPINVVLNGDSWHPDFHGFVVIDSDAWAAETNETFSCTTYNPSNYWEPHRHFDFRKAFEGRMKHTVVAFWGKMACIMDWDGWPREEDAMECAYCGKRSEDCFPEEFQFFVEQGKR